MGMRRSVVGAAIYVGVRPADHVQRFVLDLVHQPRRRGAAAVGYPVSVPGILVGPGVVDQGMALGGEVRGVDLGLFRVVIVVAGSFDHVGRVVCRAAQSSRG